ncbi:MULTISPECIES: hypothetical protein [unclassified Streptomyces]|uniref:hypothetical protein n=1 Tax=unclassified Streptomyces TaxID=2593676 RepID=UPI002E2E2845|nr:hypothetical protein [Streptomyces sp. NBC_00223]
MGDLEFYTDVLRSGTVLGLDAHSTPEQVEAVLGADFGEHRTGRAMIRDFGLVEFTWELASAGRSWRGLHFAVQVHRLETAGTEVVNPAIRAAYGIFPATPPRLGDVRALLDTEHWPLRELPGADPGFREMWQPESGSSVLVGLRESALSSEPEDLPVYRIGAPCTHGQAVRRAMGPVGRRPALDRLDHLRGLSAETRADWLARRGPRPDEGRANWWLYHLEVIDFRISQRGDEQGAWIELKLWLLDQGERQGLFTAMATAESRAWFVAALHDRYAPLSGQTVVPDADSLVRDCLATIPGTPADLARRADLHSYSRPELLRSRRAGNLIRAAEQHRTRLRDPLPAACLDGWSDLRPQLV